LHELLIAKRREFNLETHFAFVDYEKEFDSVKRQKLFNILKEKEKNIPNLLLKYNNLLEIYTNNKISTEINNKTTEERVKVKVLNRADHYHQYIYIYIYIERERERQREIIKYWH
jgi:hypothetical protein